MAFWDYLDDIGTVGGFLLGGPAGAAIGRTAGGLFGGESEGVGGMLKNAAQGFGMGALGSAIPGVSDLSGTLGGVAAPTVPTPAVTGSSIRPPGGGVPAITAPGAQGNITVPPMTAPTPAAPAQAGGGIGATLRNLAGDVGGFIKENPMLVGGGLQAFSAYQAAQLAEEERKREQRRREAQSSIALPMLMSRLRGAT